jgi:O-antigen ligase
MKVLNIERKDLSFFLPLFISLYLLFSFFSVSMIAISLFLAFLFWLFLIFTKKEKLSFPTFYWALIVYSILSLVAATQSFFAKESLRDCKELLLYLIVPIVYVGFRKVEEVNTALLFLLASGVTASLYSIFYYFIKAAPGERVSGFMGHYMTQAGLLILFSALAMSMLLFIKTKLRYIWGAALLLSLSALVLTLTRNAWVGIFVAACFLLFLYKPKALILVPVAAGLFLLASPRHVRDRALSIFSMQNTTNKQRIEFVKGGLKVIKNYPLFGTGQNMVNVEIQKDKYGLSMDSKEHAVHLHNNIIQIGAERGIPTLLAWLIFMSWIFFSLIKLLKNKDPALYPLTAGALAAFLALVAAGFFEYNFGDSEVSTLFLFLMTIPFVIHRIQKDQSQSEI